MSEELKPGSLLQMATTIVAAHVSKSTVPAAEIPRLIGEIYQALTGLANGRAAIGNGRQDPAVSVKKSVTPDYIICLECGRKQKMLKRHLRTTYGLSPEQYRAKWGLPPEYPMVSPNYAKKRSSLARQIGLGTGGRRR
ncbi:MAG TPA: MucR family transcriptional regulator [Candidatus Binatia bacterium]|nr:MucR family transcriptional regulator [Candidatus Binatia bacterium]